MIRDLRFAFRSLLRAPAFSLVAVLTIGLGVGASTAIYSVVDGVLLEPFPYEAPERLVAVSQVVEATGATDGISVANARDLRERMTSFLAMATMEPYGIDFIGADGPVALDTWLVSEEFFQVMGVPALLGRTLTPEDYTAGRSAVVIGHGMWQERFGGDPEIVGRKLEAGEAAFEIVGVMPPEFDYPRGRAVWPRSIEMLFHEASHVDGLEEPLKRAIAAAWREVGRGEPPERLWQDFIFYTSGEATRLALAARGWDGYQHYGAYGVYRRGERWQTELPAFEAHWRPFMEGTARPGVGDPEEARRAALAAFARYVTSP
jgi:hypothetical protein